jgi:hypothetical protein
MYPESQNILPLRMGVEFEELTDGNQKVKMLESADFELVSGFICKSLKNIKNKQEFYEGSCILLGTSITWSS